MVHDLPDDATQDMATSWTRITPIAGLITVLLIVVGVATYANLSVNDPTSTLTNALLQNKGRALVSTDAQLLSVIPFLVFLAGFSQMLRRAEGREGPYALLTVVGGVGLALIIVLWQAALGATVLAAQYTGVEQARPLIALGDTLDQVSPLPLAVFAGAASLHILQTGALSRWIGWLGALTAILAAFGGLDIVDAESLLDKVGLIALVLWLVWMIAVSISLLRRRGERTETVRHRKAQPVSNEL